MASAQSASNEAVKFQLKQIARKLEIDLDLNFSFDEFETEEALDE